MKPVDGYQLEENLHTIKKVSGRLSVFFEFLDFFFIEYLFERKFQQGRQWFMKKTNRAVAPQTDTEALGSKWFINS